MLAPSDRRPRRELILSLDVLIGSGDRIVLFTLPFAAVGVILNIAYPQIFSVGGPGAAVRLLSVVMLAAGIANWAWSVFLILTNVPRGRLITTGPYALVKHPLYTGMALLVLPSVGFLLNSWLGVALGIVLYVATRIFARSEEEALSKAFGAAWNEYRSRVKISWL